MASDVTPTDGVVLAAGKQKLGADPAPTVSSAAKPY
jgi:hypothetical protein